MKLRTLLLLALACSVGHAGSLLFKPNFGTYQTLNYDAFAYANGALPSPWATITSQTLEWTVSSNTATTSSAASDNGVRFTTIQPPANQFAQITLTGTLGTLSPNDGYCAAVRMSSSATTYYFGCCNGAGSSISDYVAGTPTGLISQTTTTCAAGDVVLLQAIGTTLTQYRIRAGTWTQLSTTTDSSIATGFCGMAYSSTDTGAVSLFQCGAIN